LNSYRWAGGLLWAEQQASRRRSLSAEAGALALAPIAAESQLAHQKLAPIRLFAVASERASAQEWSKENKRNNDNNNRNSDSKTQVTSERRSFSRRARGSPSGRASEP